MRGNFKFNVVEENAMKLRSLGLILLMVMSVILLSGCGLNYKISDPIVSEIKYDNSGNKQVLIRIEDARTNKEFHLRTANLKRVNIKLENVENPIKWLSQSLNNEFAARGIPVGIVDKESPTKADLVLTVKKYEIVSRRVSGFSPWITTHSFLGELQAEDKTCEIPAFFYGGKVPVWSMDEILSPCFNNPMSVVVKEIASKINRCTLGYSLSNRKVEQLAITAKQRVGAGTKDSYLSVLELGGSNNPSAMKALIDLSDNSDYLIKGVALSSIGTLGAENEFDFLKQKYAQSTGLGKFMALKSIGDIGSDEAMSFYRQVKTGSDYKNSNGIKHCVDLYLNR